MKFINLLGMLHDRDVLSLSKFLGSEDNDIMIINNCKKLTLKIKTSKYPILDRLILNNRGEWEYAPKEKIRILK